MADFQVFDEAGSITSVGTVWAATAVVRLTTEVLENSLPNVPPFGSIEWTFRNNHLGLATWQMAADDRFSVGMTGTCIN